MTASSREPVYDIAHLGHAALLTPDLAATTRYFVDLLGMDVVGESAGVAYLRGYGVYERYCLKLVAADQPGLAHVAWRTSSPAALERRVAALDALGVPGAWVEPDFGVGAAYEFRDPDGHAFRIYFDTERYVAPEGKRSVLPTNVQRYEGRGANVRLLDHVNLMARDVRANREFWEAAFGLRTYEIIRRADGTEAGAWMSSTIQGHELIYVQDGSRTGAARLHHLAFAVESRSEVLRAADVLSDAGIMIEAGPSKHTVVQGFYLYTREPGGNRIEVANGGYLVFAPDAQPYVWSDVEYSRKPGWGAPMPASFNTYGTPEAE